MVAAFNLEKLVLEVLAKMGLIRAEQLAGLMPSTSLSTSVLGASSRTSFLRPARTPSFTVVTRSLIRLITSARATLLYELYFIYTEYHLKIHWARLRPLPQYERNLGYKYLGPDGARATKVGLR